MQKCNYICPLPTYLLHMCSVSSFTYIYFHKQLYFIYAYCIYYPCLSLSLRILTVKREIIVDTYKHKYKELYSWYTSNCNWLAFTSSFFDLNFCWSIIYYYVNVWVWVCVCIKHKFLLNCICTFSGRALLYL